MTRSRCIFPLIPRLCTLFRLACYISREAFLIIVPVKMYRLLLIRFDTGIFRRCIGTLTVLSYRCGPICICLPYTDLALQVRLRASSAPRAMVAQIVMRPRRVQQGRTAGQGKQPARTAPAVTTAVHQVCITYARGQKLSF